MLNYKIIEITSSRSKIINVLADNVNEQIKNKWEPLGGPSFESYQSGGEGIKVIGRQAMIFREPTVLYYDDGINVVDELTNISNMSMYFPDAPQNIKNDNFTVSENLCA